ncbi:Crp/Fnr family transcriptional regulator [Azohydromonas lata]|uniref:Crp/Fnr family transcriptional regulator n=1 Tax=Azohydromonas lata TaxID=45677 RepID=A0ABU5IF37_9BURK|nr:Crp/Fnr family transcriptional regulator [Azohydromonas lata]MDZ5457741.1 Crp/Fnr family transcriptional regulator [Azohydromonas lata]
MDLRQFDTPRYLSVLPLFSDLRPAELQNLAEGCQLRRYARGEPVFRCGDPCEAFHVVVTGQVKLHAISPAGQEKVIELVGPSNSFGEALVFSDRPCIVNATALADSLLLGVRKEAVFGEISRDPRFALRMLAGMSRRLHGLINDVEAYALHSGMQRVIGYLLREQHSDGEGDATATVSLPVSKATIASRLSITPEYFSRVLGELETVGLIEVDKRDIRILDAQRLARYPLQ